MKKDEKKNEFFLTKEDKTKSKFIRGGAAEALGIIEDQAAYHPLLKESKNHPDPYVKWKAGEALKKIKSPGKGIMVQTSPSVKSISDLAELPGAPVLAEVGSEKPNPWSEKNIYFMLFSIAVREVQHESR